MASPDGGAPEKKVKPPLAADDPRHGTVNGYGNLGCRCTRCRLAATETKRLWQASRKSSLESDDPRHGSLNAYQNYGCRCDLCRLAQHAGHAKWIAKRQAVRKDKYR